MKVSIFKIAACAAVALTASVASAGDDVLYWMVDSGATITTDSESNPQTTATISEFFANIGDYFPDISTGEGSAFAARVRVTGGNITEDTFLDLYIPGSGVDVGGGAYGVEFDTVGGYWGAGVPTGNQSPSGDYSAGCEGIFRPWRLHSPNVRHQSWADRCLDAGAVHGGARAVGRALDVDGRRAPRAPQEAPRGSRMTA